MATTPNPLVWNTSRHITSENTSLGGLAHYYTEDAQYLYLKNGDIYTQTLVPKAGHWSTAVPIAPDCGYPNEPGKLTDDLFTDMRFDHPSEGILYGIATDGMIITFLRYMYSIDISNFCDSFDFCSDVDSPIYDISADIMNYDRSVFGETSSLFNPGAVVKAGIKMGNLKSYPLGVFWLDSIDMDARGETVSISARNNIGFRLKDQTFDEHVQLTGTASQQIKELFDYSKVKKYLIQEYSNTETFEFKPNQTIMDCIETMCEAYSSPSTDFIFKELSDGTIVIGYEDWVSTKIANSVYTFWSGKEVFNRKSKRSLDAAYSYMRATGQDANGNDLTPLTFNIPHFGYWNLGDHKTKHIEAPKAFTQEEFNVWAQNQANSLVNVGITETFEGPLRPQLLVGDIARINEGGNTNNLGIITEVKHSFSRSKGFSTEFSVDSGGTTTQGSDYIIYSKSSGFNGYNRNQRLSDLVKVLSKK